MTKFADEARAFAATTRRQWLEIKRYPAMFVSLTAWALVLPLTYVAQAKGFSGDSPRALAAFAGRAGTSDSTAYLYLGWAMNLWISSVLWGPGMRIREERIRGTLESIFLTPVSRFTITFGASPAYLAPTIPMFIFVFAALRFAFGVPISLADALRGLGILVIATPTLLAIGGVFSAAALRFQDATGLVQAVRGIFTLLCGVTYPLAVLPQWARAAGEMLPPTYAIAMLRRAVLGATGWPSDLHAFAVFAAAPLILGAGATLLVRNSMRHARDSGKLGQF